MEGLAQFTRMSSLRPGGKIQLKPIKSQHLARANSVHRMASSALQFSRAREIVALLIFSDLKSCILQKHSVGFVSRTSRGKLPYARITVHWGSGWRIADSVCLASDYVRDPLFLVWSALSYCFPLR